MASTLAGSWANVVPDTRGITRATLQVQGDMVTVEMWGACSPSDCDWGQVSVPLSDVFGGDADYSLVPVWNFANGIVATERLTTLRNGQLLVQSENECHAANCDFDVFFADNLAKD